MSNAEGVGGAANKQRPNRAAIVYHPEKTDLRRLKIAVAKALESPAARAKGEWLETLWFATSATSKGAEEAKAAVLEGATVIAVAGGDGTLREVVQAIYKTDIAVGIIPLGTGNILARNLGLPLNQINATVSRALLGNDRHIDLGQVTMTFADRKPLVQIFSGFAGVGLDATIILNTNPELKRRIGWIAYVDAGMRSRPIKFERLELSVDGKPRRHLKVHTLMIGNCTFLPGNITVMPEAKLDDGLLDVAAVGPRQFWNWVDLWGRITWLTWLVRPAPGGRQLLESTRNVKTLENLSGTRMEIWPESATNVQLDGDGFGQIEHARFDVLTKALRVRS
jgi:diacylglycerol kinase (ATP)